MGTSPRRMTTIFLWMVFAILMEAAAQVASAGVPPLPKACLKKDVPNLEKVVARFSGLEPSENMVRFYEKLKAARALPCELAALDESAPSVSHYVLKPPHRSLATTYPEKQMNRFVCSVNPSGCRKGKPTAQSLYLPSVNWNTTFPVWHRVPLTAKDTPEQGLEEILKRHSITIPETGERSPAEWLDTIRKANLDFTRDLTRGTKSADGKVVRQRFLVVPVTEYRATFEIPASVLEAAQKWKIEDFSLEPAVGPKPSARSTPTVESFRSSFDAARKMISMPAALPPARNSDLHSVVVADRAIDPTCGFLKPGSTLVAPIASNLLEKCSRDTHHGTHVWGIIAGRVPDIMRGVAVDDSNNAPRIDPYDHNTDASWDLPNFISSNFPVVRVVNLSIDFQDELVPLQERNFQNVVETLPGIVYVVAADNSEILYDNSSDLPFPIRLHDEQNVIVVTTLDQTGEGILKGAGRNRTRKHEDDVVLLAAPGVGIPSACVGAQVGVLEGTSQATAFVSGAASLLVRDGLEDGRKVKWRLAYTADVLTDLVEGVSAGRLNVARALGASTDKWCANSENNHETCLDPKSESVALGFLRDGTFVQATQIMMYALNTDPHGVYPSYLLRVVRNSDDTFTVFYLDRVDGDLYLRRRVNITKLEAFSDPNTHGPMVVKAPSAGQDGVLDSTELGDLTRRLPGL